MDKELLNRVQIWYQVDAELTRFGNNATSKTFNIVFPIHDSGKRLWKHYVNDCGRDFTKFRTYLSYDEFEAILTMIHTHSNELYTN